MIDIVSGQITTVSDHHVVIMIGGIGLRIHVPTTVLDLVDGPGQRITLYTHLAVREDDLTLYGFSDQDERTLFETLLKVCGVGPRLALAILSTLSVEHLNNAVAREEPDILTRVPGIGKKLAQKLVGLAHEHKGNGSGEAIPNPDMPFPLSTNYKEPVNPAAAQATEIPEFPAVTNNVAEPALTLASSEPESAKPAAGSTNTENLNVWVLGASLGGPQAVRQFLATIYLKYHLS